MTKEQAYREHLASLSNVYFERARNRLTSEQGWARGQVQRERPTNEMETQRDSEKEAQRVSENESNDD